MTSYCDGGVVKWFILSVLLCQVSSLPKSFNDGNSVVKEIFSESKRDISSSGGPAVVPLLKSPIFNPYLMYPPVVPAKPIFYPPLLSPNDVILSRLGKSASTKAPPLDGSDPTLISAYFKAKKDEFLSKLFERLMNTTETVSEKMARSVTVVSDATPPTFNSSYFLKKKYEFLETLFKALNATPSSVSVNVTEDNETTTTTPKPTIVPPDFWFPFPKTAKTPKPPKPTKPPKAKKILKDALDTILLQSLLFDLGVDPQEAAINKRTTTGTAPSKKIKSKKLKEDSASDESEEVDPSLYSTKASECLEKMLKFLNKTEGKVFEKFVKPKPTEVPVNVWTKPEAEFTSKLDAFLDLLIKSLNATEVEQASPKLGKYEKLKGKPKKLKRSAFLDELLHRITTTPAPTTTVSSNLQEKTPETQNCKMVLEILKECFCEEKCKEFSEEPNLAKRSLIFRPFGSGAWIPQYLYAAKMGIYLDKLMDSINTAAITDAESGSSDILKRSLDAVTSGEDVSGLPSKEAAIKLIIAELSVLKDGLIDAFTDGIKAQKDAMPTPKSYGPPGKSFKKPFWGGKAGPTVDPVAPIQKRIDVLNDVYDKLTKVEKTLMFTSEPEYNPKLLSNLTEILQLTSSKKNFNSVKTALTNSAPDTESPAYFLAKTKEYLQNFYGDKMTDSDKK